MTWPLDIWEWNMYLHDHKAKRPTLPRVAWQLANPDPYSSALGSLSLSEILTEGF
ncbi:uncharacterized protein ACLA_067530 [Aspergillus clavatus NRRL 1]|uniref:Uncharacterized protein n=1 Tax=Aspergillus clavatus (strain ATCC 1007 / CBS 513.65 / DSM 816 / NCTC 3887 / NRRL 1 / QM 1276 / 107) TaxID=344612 RepID=A1CGN4_ASPCL|nr:uncharacterized protein ACLA_067530 [Aspergillus clavatus NRRL 1]EAW11114.1 hypothetical protein ACLA_067530 [Aspergillus clavatus NRRL 1]